MITREKLVKPNLTGNGVPASWFESAGVNASWQELTGKLPGESQFTLVVPIRNERRAMPAFLNVLNHAVLPNELNARIILATNGCDDESPEMAMHYIHDLADGADYLEKVPTAKGIVELHTADRGGLRFSHLDLQTPGKANALNKAAEIARADGNRVLISADANTYPEPQAIAKLYAQADEAFMSGRAVIVWGTENFSYRPGGLELKLLQKSLDRNIPDTSNPNWPHGWLFAVDSEWLPTIKIGKFPETCTEDRAISVIAKVEGQNAEMCMEAVVHGYRPNNFRDNIKSNIRNLRGDLQLGDMDESYREEVEATRPDFSRNMNDRLDKLMNDLRGSRRRIPRTLLRFAYWETLYQLALADHRREPNRQDWDRINSTM